MKIVDRTTFLSMPSGTVFCKYSPCVFGELHIKGDSIFFAGGDDFFIQQIVDAIDAFDTCEFMDMLESARKTGVSVPMDFHVEQRDGLFDKDQLFAVWERSDVEALITRLGETLE